MRLSAWYSTFSHLKTQLNPNPLLSSKSNTSQSHKHNTQSQKSPDLDLVIWVPPPLTSDPTAQISYIISFIITIIIGFSRTYPRSNTTYPSHLQNSLSLLSYFFTVQSQLPLSRKPKPHFLSLSSSRAAFCGGLRPFSPTPPYPSLSSPYRQKNKKNKNLFGLWGLSSNTLCASKLFVFFRLRFSLCVSC